MIDLLVTTIVKKLVEVAVTFGGGLGLYHSQTLEYRVCLVFKLLQQYSQIENYISNLSRGEICVTSSIPPSEWCQSGLLFCVKNQLLVHSAMNILLKEYFRVSIYRRFSCCRSS